MKRGKPTKGVHIDDSFEIEGLDRLLRQSPNEWRKEAQADAEVSKFHLDDACATQGGYYSKWAGLYGVANTYRHAVDDLFEAEKAALDLKVRTDPHVYGLEVGKEGRPMETAVRSVINTHKRIKALKREQLLARHYEKLTEHNLTAMEHRKTMIRMLGDLWLGEYKPEVQIRDEREDGFRERMVGRKRRRRINV